MYRSYKELGQTPEEKEILYQQGYKYELIEDYDHKQHILNHNRVVCIEIYGDWCMPCKQIRPIYAKIAEKYHNPGSVFICGEDYDKKLSPTCTVVPTFYFYNKGQLVQTIIGADMIKIENELVNLIENTSHMSNQSVYKNDQVKNKFQNFHGRNPAQ